MKRAVSVSYTKGDWEEGLQSEGGGLWIERDIPPLECLGLTR
jgi:hypothetical protein